MNNPNGVDGDDGEADQLKKQLLDGLIAQYETKLPGEKLTIIIPVKTDEEEETPNLQWQPPAAAADANAAFGMQDLINALNMDDDDFGDDDDVWDFSPGANFLMSGDFADLPVPINIIPVQEVQPHGPQQQPSGQSGAGGGAPGASGSGTNGRGGTSGAGAPSNNN